MTRAKKKRTRASRRVGDPRGTAQWPLWVMAARDIMLGASQAQAAAGISRTDRTLRMWMKHDAWADAEQDAYDLAIKGTLHKAMRTVDRSVERNPNLAWEFMQRALKQLASVSKHEVSGKDGKPIEHAATVTIYVPDNGRGG